MELEAFRLLLGGDGGVEQEGNSLISLLDFRKAVCRVRVKPVFSFRLSSR